MSAHHTFPGHVVAIPHTDRILSRSIPRPILLVGRDKALLQSRQEIILSRSDLRIRALTPEDAEAAARAADERVWIFCSSIELPKVVYLACSVRRYSPASRLLLIKRVDRPAFEDSLFHRVIPAAEGIESFLDALSSLALEA